MAAAVLTLAASFAVAGGPAVPGAAVAQAADSSPAPSAGPSPSSGDAWYAGQPTGPQPSGTPLSSAELAARAQREAGVLAQEQQQRTIADAAAAAALERYQLAQRRAEQSELLARQELTRLASAEKATVGAREQLSRYIGSMYRRGLGDGGLSAYSPLLTAETPQKLFSGLSLAQRVGVNQDDALDALRVAEAEQEAASQRAAAADAAQELAATEAAAAKKLADAAVAAAVERVAAASATLLDTRAAEVVAAAREALLLRAEAIARERSMAPEAAIDGAFTVRPVPTCTGAPTGGYPNGGIPTAALCPLWGTSGHILRADAAASFNALSRAYAAEFGTPVCVTDSYRDLPGQVAVRAAKPTLAAVPGTSNHGWGVAVDLCDGIQTFGSPQHLWMQEQSMAFGWFHPSWAQQGGSKPEPWHWEFAG